MDSPAITDLGCLRFYVDINFHLSTCPVKMQGSHFHTLDLTRDNLEAHPLCITQCCIVVTFNTCFYISFSHQSIISRHFTPPLSIAPARAIDQKDFRPCFSEQGNQSKETPLHEQ